MNEFGEYLKALRGKKSIREVAEGIGVSHTYLTTLEKGFDPRTKKSRKPTPDVINKIAAYYNIRNGDLALKAGYDPFEYVHISSEFFKDRDVQHLLKNKEEVYYDRKLLTSEQKKRALAILDALFKE